MTVWRETHDIENLERLLQATADGDRRAFARVYQMSSRRLYQVALRILRRREIAEEVLQEAFILIWRKSAQFDPNRGKGITWMSVIVRSCAIDRLRREAREPNGMLPWDESTEVLTHPAISAPQTSDHIPISLKNCLEKLQEQERQTILLAYYYGMTHSELAAHMKKPLGTVKTWVRRGLLKLGKCLDQ